MKKIIFLSFTLIMCLLGNIQAQKKCGFETIFNRLAQDEEFIKQQDDFNLLVKNFKNDKMDTVINIPTVIHIIYKNANDNISLSQIQSQLNVLNQDFRKMNADTTNAAGFSKSDVKFNFELAIEDPNGNATTGITRTQTTHDSIGTTNQYYQLVPAWNRNRYLNIWVCNVGSFNLGFAFPPNASGVSPDEDGVVIGTKYFGTTGTVEAPYNKGRTTTHEIGHFFNLIHIWGRNQSCNSDDGVSDTPNQREEIYGCPSSNVSCGSNDMLSNYMGYIDDRCMGNFTLGQKNRMRTAIYNLRDSLQYGNKLGIIGIQEHNVLLHASLFPNPTQSEFDIVFDQDFDYKSVDISISNLQGKLIGFKSQSSTRGLKIQLTGAVKGVYLVSLKTSKSSATKKLILH